MSYLDLLPKELRDLLTKQVYSPLFQIFLKYLRDWGRYQHEEYFPSETLEEFFIKHKLKTHVSLDLNKPYPEYKTMYLVVYEIYPQDVVTAAMLADYIKQLHRESEDYEKDINDLNARLIDYNSCHSIRLNNILLC